mgnify:CR=1 FL=1
MGIADNNECLRVHLVNQDLIARLLKLPLAWLPMGKLLLVVDLSMLLAVSIAFIKHQHHHTDGNRASLGMIFSKGATTGGADNNECLRVHLVNQGL